MVERIRTNTLLFSVILCILCVTTFYIYSKAFSAPWQYDDAPSLESLHEVADGKSPYEFVFSGISSNLGRPISLASFLLNIHDWPSNPEGFRYINTLLHILNGVLIIWITLRLTLLLPNIQREHRTAIAVTASAFWMLHPFLASSSLLIVQRMSLLSCTFTLFGLLIYLLGRKIVLQRRFLGYILMSTGVSGGAIIGTLAKENAALLPFYIFAIEGLILQHNKAASTKYIRLWKFIFIGIPAITLFIYTTYYWNSFEVTYSHRNFDLMGRLQHEAIILWNYIRQLLIPNIFTMGPFHDDLEFSKPDTNIALAGAASLLILIGISLIYRKKYPLLLFATSWFLFGHILESTIYPMELYFEHRNYTPSIGIFIAISITLWSSIPKYAFPLSITTSGILAFLLLRTTSLWSSTLISAETWYAAHPQSPRAVQFLARTQIEYGLDDKGLKTLRNAANQIPEAGDLALQILQVECVIEADRAPIRRDLEEILSSSHRYAASTAIVDSVDKLIQFIGDKTCPELTYQDIIRLNTALLANPKIKAYTQIANALHIQLSNLYREQKNFGATVSNLKEAYKLIPDINTAIILAGTLVSGGYSDDAILVLKEAREKHEDVTFGSNHKLEMLNILQLAIENNSGAETTHQN
jgi:protein O-mannosyl-transferase